MLATTTTTRPKILYIEGHAALRDVYRQLLQLTANFEIDVAPNGVCGVQKATAWRPDLILLGLRLPYMDGFETIRTLRSNPCTAAVPIIVISAWNSAKHRQHAFAAGANAHLTPPVPTEQLVAKINHFLR